MSERSPTAGVSRPVWEVSRRIVMAVARVVYRYRRSGRENMPRTGGALLVANHISNKDPVLVGAAVLPRPVHFMAKAELFRVPVLAGLIRRLGAFPVRRGEADRDAIRIARDLLARGEAVVMFPEGTRSPDGILLPPFAGAGSLALVPGVTVVPAAIWGSQRTLGPVRVVVGEPVDLSDITDGSRSERAREAARRIMAAIAELVPQAGGPEQPDSSGAALG